MKFAKSVLVVAALVPAIAMAAPATSVAEVVTAFDVSTVNGGIFAIGGVLAGVAAIVFAVRKVLGMMRRG